MRRVFHLFQAILLLLLASTAAADNELTATVDRNTIGVDETLNLRLRYSGKESGGQPDFELLEQDFDILSRQQSNQYRVINGRAESYVEWMLTLAPKREGRLFVPSLHLHGQVSDAIPITVTEAGSTPDNDDRKAFLEVELDKDQVYVQEQLLIKVRLYTVIGLHDISTEPLQIPGAHIEKVDEQRYERRINGVGHAVYELTYAIFPESSGKLRIPALTYVAVAGRRDPFSLFNRNTQRMRLRSEAKEVEVLPKPDSYSGKHWLPAASLGIVQSWSQDPDSFKVGEPITRIVTIRAEGLRAAQLPPLPKINVEGLKTYPDQPQQDDQAGANGISGSRIETTAIVATKPGEYQLPPITLSWWDTKSGRQRVTQLPAFRFTVSGAPMASGSDSSQTAPPGPNRSNQLPADHFWRNLAIIAVASHLMWIIYLWWFRQHLVPSQTAKTPSSQNSDSEQTKRLFHAVETGDPVRLQKELKQWLQSRWPNLHINSISDASKLLEFEELDKLHGLLNNALYVQPPRPLNRQQVEILVRRLVKHESSSAPTQTSSALPELFS
ncbi:BatD family protein [Microbulbifer sediminum]|uniref:BatD family protein n=1 Tax=Microbulbifer sediminum TaxID=2904250 RepID=UPI001F381746|nr:BatD family protein [Microbulbifer sediminum]